MELLMKWLQQPDAVEVNEASEQRKNVGE